MVAHRKKAIVTKQKEAKNEAKNEYLAPGGVKKISNARVHGRAVGSMSYDPQVRSRAHQNMGPYTSTCMNSPLGQRRWQQRPEALASVASCVHLHRSPIQDVSQCTDFFEPRPWPTLLLLVFPGKPQPTREAEERSILHVHMS